MTIERISLYKTVMIIVGFPLAYMLYSMSGFAQELFVHKNRDFYIPFWSGILALHWLSVFAVAIALKTSGRKFSDIGFKLTRKKALFLILLYAFIAFAALGAVEFVLTSGDIQDDKIMRLPGLIPITFGQRLFFLLLVFSTAFCEETVYRGFAITGLSDAGLNRWLGLLVAAFMFVGIHGINAYTNRFLYLFGGAVVFGILYLTTKNLLPSIFVHLLINLSAMFMILQMIE